MQAGWGRGLAGASGPVRSRPSSSSFGWFSQPCLPSRRSEKGILAVACESHIQPTYPGRPLLLHHLPLQALLHFLCLKRPVGLPPCSRLFHTCLCCWALHSPCRSQLESFCFSHWRPPPHPRLPALLRFNCVPPCCHFEAHIAVTIIRRSNGWIVGLSGLFHAFSLPHPQFSALCGQRSCQSCLSTATDRARVVESGTVGKSHPG